METIAIVLKKFVTMMPSFEWTFLLRVGKVMVPFEFGNGSSPLAAPGKPTDRAQGSVDDRSGAGNVMNFNRIQILRWWRRGSNQLKAIHFGLKLRWHQARQILGIREESEDLRNGNRNPVGELKLVGHGAELGVN